MGSENILNVLRTSTVLLKPTDTQSLSEYAEQSAILWNIANYERRKAFYEHMKMPSYALQCRELKHTEPFKKLGTCKAQALLSKLNEAWQSFHALLRLKKKGKLPPHIRKIRPPKYWKRNGKREAKAFYVRNDGWRMNEKEISISRNRIPYQCGELWVGKWGRLEVIKDEINRRWYAHIPVEVDWQPPSRSQTDAKKASLDLGICNLATLYIEGERPIIYSGRAVLSDWIYHTKEIADKQSKLPRKRHASKRIRLQFRRRQRRLKHAINAMLRSIFSHLEQGNVSELYIGDLNGIREEANHGKRGNQKLHLFWAYDKIVKRILELGEEYGIIVKKVSERDTSRTCCLCGKQHNGRIERGLMICREKHKSINADVNGAVNILNVAVKRSPPVLSTDSYEGKTSGSGLMAQPLPLRWNYHEWS
ncbi:MAG: IS200/IS605 family element transposase accessory protein TnpB [Candidatus Verstraetearchaeota archaeon]|nr:IS200/IS605 family element transposase accessory protein TnpB [Candidatus Verstraetearchaeota archaeon]